GLRGACRSHPAGDRNAALRRRGISRRACRSLRDGAAELHETYPRAGDERAGSVGEERPGAHLPSQPGRTPQCGGLVPAPACDLGGAARSLRSLCDEAEEREGGCQTAVQIKQQDNQTERFRVMTNSVNPALSQWSLDREIVMS